MGFELMIKLQLYVQRLRVSSCIFFTMLLEKIQRANCIDIGLLVVFTIEICQFAHPHRLPYAHSIFGVDKVCAMEVEQVRMAYRCPFGIVSIILEQQVQRFTLEWICGIRENLLPSLV